MSLQVATSNALFRTIRSFQKGVHYEDAPVTQLACAAPHEKAPLTIHHSYFLVFHTTFSNWFHTNGVYGLHRLLASSTYATHQTLLAYAAWIGNVPLLRYLFNAVPVVSTTSTLLLDIASSQGHMQAVIYLHELPGVLASTGAMNGAAANGHLEIVQFLHFNRPEGCTTDAIDQAAESGHLEVIQWLGYVRDARCTIRALDAAATRGHLQVVHFLVDELGILCSASALIAAAYAGHHAVVRVLWSKLLDKENARAIAIRQASLGGHAHVAQLLAATCM